MKSEDRRSLIIALLAFLTGGAVAGWLNSPPAAPAPRPRSSRRTAAPKPPAHRCTVRSAAEVGSMAKAEEEALAQPAAVTSKDDLSSGARLALDVRYRGAPVRIPLDFEFENGRDEYRRRWSPERPVLELPAGRYQATARRRGASIGPYNIGLGELRGEVERVVDLQEGLDLFGRILGSTERARPRFVVLEPAPDGEAEGWSREGDGFRHTPFEESFAFSVDQPGLYRLGVIYDGPEVVSLGLVAFDSEPVYVERTLPSPPERRVFPFEVLDPRGRPCSEACQVNLRSERWWLRGTRRGKSLVVRSARLSEARNLRLEARHSRFGRTQAAVELGGSTATTLRFSEPARLEVVVADFVERGFEGRHSLHWTPESGEERQVSLSAEGVAVFKDLPTTRGLLRFGEGERCYARRPLELKPGEQTVVLDAPQVARLELRVIGEPLTNVYLRKKGHSISLSFASQSRAVLFDLPHGRYQLSYDRENREVLVPGPPVIIDRRARRELRVRITDPEGAYARLGLRDGDRILAIDGRAIRANDQGLWGRKRRLLIRRGEREIALTVDVFPNMDTRALLGGALEPIGD